MLEKQQRKTELEKQGSAKAEQARNEAAKAKKQETQKPSKAEKASNAEIATRKANSGQGKQNGNKKLQQ